MSIKNLLSPTALKRLDLHPNSYCSKCFQKSVQVCVLGGNTRLGTYTSFLLKQNPLISSLHIQGCFPIDNTGVDLNFIDTKCQANTYCGVEQSVSKAIKSADIILILPTEPLKPDAPLGERIMKEGKRLYNIASQCSIYAPRAILVVAVPPVSVTTSLVSEVLKKTNFYHPGRIVGSAATAQVKANTFLGRFQDLDPQNCYVPLVGGPDVDLAVPLYSKAKPVEVFGKNGCKTLTARFRGVPEDEFPKNLGNPNFVDDCALAESYALNQLIATIALGICGDNKALANVFVRCNLLNTCKYLVSTVRFSRGGVVHNHGLPALSKFELELVEMACLQIKQREEMAMDYIQYIENKGDHPRPPSFTEKAKKEQELLQQQIIR